MKWREIRTGTRLEISEAFGSPDPPAYVSQLLAPVLDPQAISVAVPIQAFRHIAWPRGTRLQVSFIEPGRGVWQFEATITGRSVLDRIQVYTLAAQTGLGCCQRRACFRVDCSLAATLKASQPQPLPSRPAIPAPSAETVQPPTPVAMAEAAQRAPLDPPAAPLVQAVTRNLSGGGACVVTGQELTDITELQLSMPVNGRQQTITARCRVIRFQLAGDQGRPRYEFSLQFTDIAPGDQDALIRYLNQCQLKQK